MILMTVLLGAAGTMAGGWFLLRLFEWKRLYHPHREITRTPGAEGLAYENLTLVTEDDHRIHGWWIPNTAAQVTVLICHGNTGNMSDCVDRVLDLHRMGAQVLIFDYRGYGRSRGITSERGMYLDSAAAYEWIRTTQYGDADQPPIILYGHSIGGGPAAKTAVDKSVAGLILESTFTSIQEISRCVYPSLPVWLSHFVSQRFDTLSRIARVRAPVLIAAGPDDTLVPYEMGRRLYEKANEPKQFCGLVGDHIDSGWRSTPAYEKAVRLFIGAIASGADSSIKPDQSGH